MAIVRPNAPRDATRFLDNSIEKAVRPRVNTITEIVHRKIIPRKPLCFGESRPNDREPVVIEPVQEALSLCEKCLWARLDEAGRDEPERVLRISIATSAIPLQLTTQE